MRLFINGRVIDTNWSHGHFPNTAAGRRIIYLVLFLFPFLSVNSYAQSVHSKRIIDSASVKLLESISTVKIFKGQQMIVSAFKLSNGSGSANLPESHEISQNYIFCVAHYDESPDTKVFSVGPFIDPKIIQKDDSGSFVTFIVKSGIAKARKKVKLIVSLSEVSIE